MTKINKNSLEVSIEKLKHTRYVDPKSDIEFNNHRPTKATINFEGNVSGNISFDLNRYYGKGFDDIVTRTYYTTCELIDRSHKGGVRQPTIYSYLATGFRHFSKYLHLCSISSHRELNIDDITKDMIIDFILHIRSVGVGYTTQKGIYSAVKSLLNAIASFGYWGGVSRQYINDLFPRNPYPNVNKRCKGAIAFSVHERRQLVLALKKEIKSIYQKKDSLTSYELTVCILSIAMKTGINTTPLLKMTVDAMSDHPFNKGRKLLTVYKARGNSTQLHSLQYSKQVELCRGIKLDVAYLIEHIITLNAHLRNEIGSKSLFVYRFRPNHENGVITTLSDGRFSQNTIELAKKHDLKDEDGNSFNVTISRIRKTFINGIFELSNNDIAVAAKAGKHNRKTTETHYLQAPKEAKLNLGIMGEIRVKDLTANPNFEHTPVAGCFDVIYGDMAPKNGTPCVNFLACFRCRSFLITGDDLYRVFSFYWAVMRNREYFGPKNWKKHLRNIVRVIDENIAPQFSNPDIEEIKERARLTPHPYWKNLDMLRIVR